MKKLSRQVTVGYSPITGNRIRKRVYATSKAGLDQAERELIREYARMHSDSKITVKEYMDQWFEAYCTHLAVNTQISYKTIINKCADIHNKQMKNVTRTDLQRLINNIWQYPDQCKRLAGKLNTIWELAVADGVVDRNIAVKLSRPKRTPKQKRALTKAEKEAIKKTEFTDQEQLLVDILYQFGLRPGEAFALCKSDVDFKARTLTISKSLTHEHERPKIKTTKTTKIRVLPIPDSFIKKFKNIKTFNFFVNDAGELMTKKQIYTFNDKIIRKINRTMGGSNRIRVTDMTMYTFRHNKATELYYMTGNLSLKAKAAYMGHSEEMFLRTYSHLVEDKEETELLRQVTA